jgi:uncharacterized protein YjbJ (UPF0337 family)
MLNKDERDGKIGQAKGRVKQAVGDLTGNKHLRTEGLADEAKGKVQEAAGKVRHAIGDAVTEIGKAVKR